jgi:LmbE family N-acetylglucosaminyl deacetylase
VGVVSPHLDDAVLSAAMALVARPGSVVVPVFDAGPVAVDPVTWWDDHCGFADGDDVASIRREEDDAALAMLGATGVRLGFWDEQYRNDTYGYDGPRGDALEAALTISLADAVGRLSADGGPRTWLVPLGLVHPDHELAHRAGAAVARRRPDLDWVVYLELPYAVEYPRAPGPALASLAASGLRRRRDEPVPWASQDAAAPKARALAAYATQVRGLGESIGRSLRSDERYERIVPEPDTR